MPEPLHSSAGVPASAITVPAGRWRQVLGFLAQRFPHVSEAEWRRRLAEGQVTNHQGQPVAADAPVWEGLRLQYYRDVGAEPVPEAPLDLVYEDDRLVVIDKPPFVPVTPAGQYVQRSLLVRLHRERGWAHAVPLHRIDRLTAGLVLFSKAPESRACYAGLFAQRAVAKVYDACSAVRVADDFPSLRRSRLARGTPFFRRTEVAGPPNSETRIEVVARTPRGTRFRLIPVTGRTHQLRVHLAALGAPLRNDPWYPDLQDERPDDLARPLQLVARGLRFTDPLSGVVHDFESRHRCLE